MTKSYEHCPKCNHRMKRTGKKELISSTFTKGIFYEREYECPKCEKVWMHDELKNALYQTR
ncbi:MAG: hypothetical protein ABSH06_21220 [Thermodesulfobacteriota bacterium]